MTQIDARYELRPVPPSVDDYLALRRDAGLSPKTNAQGQGAVANSWVFCHVRETRTGRTVAMGRVIGDGGWYFHIADIATDPAHQHRGLGRAVMTWLLAQIDERAPADPYISLLADPPGQALYRRLGFVDTPSLGMWRPR